MPFPVIPAAQLHARRSAYAYPPVALATAATAPIVVRFNSTFELDTYLARLLNSANDADRVLGYLGVIFWGHYSGQDGVEREARALGKVKLACDGRDFVRKGIGQRKRGVADIGAQAVAAQMGVAASAIKNASYDQALAALRTLPQIQIAFASKICAFLEADKCGVIDSVIAIRYPAMGFHLRDGYVADSVSNRRLYVDYCKYLQTTAAQMNRDPQYSQWTDLDGSPHAWRAVDIERALY